MLGVERPRVALLSVGEEAKKGTPTVVDAHAALAAAERDRLRGNVEGRDLLGGAADVIVTDGFTGNVALKTMEGTAKRGRRAVGDAARSNPLAAVGGLLLRPALGGLRREMDPDTAGGAILLGLRGVAVVGHGSSGPRGSPTPMRLAARAVEERAVERTAELLERSGATRDPPCVIGRIRAMSLNRDEVMAKVREHLATELEVDAGEIRDATRFSDDLDADSLDLYELVMELEDTYGITVSEEEAAEIETVGDAVDFVIARLPPERCGGAGIRRLGGGGARAPAAVADRALRPLPLTLRRQALTHSSWVEHRADSYGRLAFLGDSVLGLAIAEHLFRRFPRRHRAADEGPRPGRQRPRLRRGRRARSACRSCCERPPRDGSRAGSTSARCSPPSARWRRSARR